MSLFIAMLLGSQFLDAAADKTVDPSNTADI